MGDCNCGVCCCSCIDPVNDVYPCCATMIWLWQVFRWSILAITQHGHSAPHSVVTGMVKLGLVITTESAPGLLLRSWPKTVTTSFQRGFPLRRGSESLHREPPPSLMPISALLQKCAIFLWRVFELTATGRCWWCSAAFCSPPLLRWQLLRLSCGQEMPADDRSLVSSDHTSVITISWSSRLTSWYSAATAVTLLFMTAMASCWPACHINWCSLAVSTLTCVSPDPSPSETRTFMIMKCLYGAMETTTQFNLYHPEKCHQTDNRLSWSCHSSGISPFVRATLLSFLWGALNRR